MSILHRYIVKSVFKTGIVVTVLASFMLLGVDLFRNMDSYITYSVPSGVVVKLTFMFLPEAVLFAIGPAFLFAVTYFLSIMFSTNEIIIVLNSTISYSKIIRTILFCGIFTSIFYFAFSENLSLPMSMQKQRLYESYVSENSDKTDNYKIALSDMTQSYMIYADQYSPSSKTLYGITFIKVLDDATVIRTNARSAAWNDQTEHWTFTDFTTYTFYAYKDEPEIKHYDSMENEFLLLPPDMFKNLSNDISTMPLKSAANIVKQMKVLDLEQYYEMATTFYGRILNCFTPLILIIIGCSMNYRFKKNILFLSIIFSVCVAVVFYVVRIMTIIMAQQGVIAPYWGTLIPFASILILSFITSLFIRS